jgi:hypothetical protein
VKLNDTALFFSMVRGMIASGLVALWRRSEVRVPTRTDKPKPPSKVLSRKYNPMPAAVDVSPTLASHTLPQRRSLNNHYAQCRQVTMARG